MRICVHVRVESMNVCVFEYVRVVSMNVCVCAVLSNLGVLFHIAYVCVSL